MNDDEIPDDVILPIDDVIDLHAFAPRDVKDVVASYLEAASESGFREVRIIHGRGIGLQRDAVRTLLSHHPRVASFADAPPDRGGWGATIVFFRGLGSGLPLVHSHGADEPIGDLAPVLI